MGTTREQDRILPELPQTNTPVALVAASDPVTGKSEFRYRNSNTPPVIRVQPGSVLNVEYKNELAPQSKEDCFLGDCFIQQITVVLREHLITNMALSRVVWSRDRPFVALLFSRPATGRGVNHVSLRWINLVFSLQLFWLRLFFAKT